MNLKKIESLRAIIVALAMLALFGSNAWADEPLPLTLILDNRPDIHNVNDLKPIAAHQARNGPRYRSMKKETKTFEIEIVFGPGTQLAVHSDDGVRISLVCDTGNVVVFDKFENPQHLPNLEESFHAVPWTPMPGTTYRMRVDYSNVIYYGTTDMDGVTLYAYGGVASPVVCELIPEKHGTVSISPNMCINAQDFYKYAKWMVLIDGYGENATAAVESPRHDIPLNRKMEEPNAIGWDTILRYLKDQETFYASLPVYPRAGETYELTVAPESDTSYKKSYYGSIFAFVLEQFDRNEDGEPEPNSGQKAIAEDGLCGTRTGGFNNIPGGTPNGWCKSRLTISAKYRIRTVPAVAYNGSVKHDGSIELFVKNGQKVDKPRFGMYIYKTKPDVKPVNVGLQFAPAGIGISVTFPQEGLTYSVITSWNKGIDYKFPYDDLWRLSNSSQAQATSDDLLFFDKPYRIVSVDGSKSKVNWSSKRFTANKEDCYASFQFSILCASVRSTEGTDIFGASVILVDPASVTLPVTTKGFYISGE